MLSTPWPGSWHGQKTIYKTKLWYMLCHRHGHAVAQKWIRSIFFLPNEWVYMWYEWKRVYDTRVCENRWGHYLHSSSGAFSTNRLKTITPAHITSRDVQFAFQIFGVVNQYIMCWLMLEVVHVTPVWWAGSAIDLRRNHDIVTTSSLGYTSSSGSPQSQAHGLFQE